MNKKCGSFIVFLVIGLILAGCGNSPEQIATKSAPAWTPTPIPTSTKALLPLAPTPNLSQRPLVFFGPMELVLDSTHRQVPSAEDFMDLFTPNAPWAEAARHVQVFNLNGSWVDVAPWTIHASDAQLKQVIDDLNRRGIAIGVEVGPFDPISCGKDVESFGGGFPSAQSIIERIQSMGGMVRYVSLDEPFMFASLYQGQNACRWTPEETAKTLGDFVNQVISAYPQVEIADIEPLLNLQDVEGLKAWIETYRKVNGSYLASFHLDINYSLPGWPQAAKELETYVHQRGIAFGIYYTGNSNDTTDQVWLTNAGQRVKQYEDQTGGEPDHVLFQSWHEHPHRLLPETGPDTFTQLINQYFGDRSDLGVRTEGPGANLAFGKPVRVSNLLPEAPGTNAVDGNSNTAWISGGLATQWIQIDLGTPSTIAEIRLTVTMTPQVGQTTHHVLAKGPGTAGQFKLMHTFSQITEEGTILKFTPSPVWQGIQYIRIESIESPSWIAWREIEVIAGE